MRVPAFLAASLLLAGALTGCVGGDGGDGDDPTKSSVPGATGGAGAAVKAAAPANLKVLAALSSEVTLDAPQWITSGTEIPLSVAAPAAAKGSVNYTWAVGPLPGTVDVEAVKLDTGSAKGSDYIQPGKNASLKFATSGTFQMHCHPHPYMLQNVTVIDGLAPSVQVVYIVDGATNAENRFIPETLVIGAGSTVVYENIGEMPHTATLMTQGPALTQLPVTGSSGNVSIEGEGWQRIVVAMTDSEGRAGVAEASIYVTEELPTFEPKTITFSYDAGGLPPEAQEVIKDSVTFDYNGTLTLNYTAKDAAARGGSPTNNAAVEIHLRQVGETQDTLTSEANAEGSLSARIAGADYAIEIIPKGGVGVEGTIVMTVVYDLVPPAPAKPAADAGHGGHGGHGGGGHDH